MDEFLRDRKRRAVYTREMSTWERRRRGRGRISTHTLNNPLILPERELYTSVMVGFQGRLTSILHCIVHKEGKGREGRKKESKKNG